MNSPYNKKYPQKAQLIRVEKIIKDCCNKTVFSFNNVIYRQRDGVSMGSALSHILANVIMTELEKEILMYI